MRQENMRKYLTKKKGKEKRAAAVVVAAVESLEREAPGSEK